MVTATGSTTEMGKIGALIDAVGDHGTPLEAKLAQLSRALLLIVLGLCAMIVFVGWLRGMDLLYLVEVGISLAIAAITTHPWRSASSPISAINRDFPAPPRPWAPLQCRAAGYGLGEDSGTARQTTKAQARVTRL